MICAISGGSKNERRPHERYFVRGRPRLLQRNASVTARNRSLVRIVKCNVLTVHSSPASVPARSPLRQRIFTVAVHFTRLKPHARRYLNRILSYADENFSEAIPSFSQLRKRGNEAAWKRTATGNRGFAATRSRSPSSNCWLEPAKIFVEKQMVPQTRCKYRARGRVSPSTALALLGL